MAIDTAVKRASVLGFAAVAIISLPFPDTSVDTVDRVAITHSYAGTDFSGFNGTATNDINAIGQSASGTFTSSVTGTANNNINGIGQSLTGTGPETAPSGGGGGSWDSHRQPSLAGINLRSHPFKSKAIEEEIEEVVEETIEYVEQVEEPDNQVPGQDIAKLARNKLLARQSVVRQLRKTEKLSKRVAEAQVESRVNELVRKRRLFFKSENEDLQAILFILSEIL